MNEVDPQAAAILQSMQALATDNSTAGVDALLNEQGYQQLLGGAPIEPNTETQAEPTPEQAAPTPTPSASDTAPAAAQPAGGDAPQAPTGEIEGVLLKDGKSVLPFSVLKAQRDQANAYKRKVDQLEGELKTLREKLEKGSAPESAEDDPIASLNPEAVNAEDLVKAIHALRKQIDEAKAATPAQPKPDQQQAAEAGPEDVQAAIDRSPNLLTWQTHGGREWDLAVQLDASIRDLPEWANKSLDERFAHVAKTVAATFNQQFIDPSSKPNTAGSAVDKPAAATPPAATAPITSLSDIPGGGPPSEGIGSQLENASGAAVLANMANMSDAQIERALRGLY